MKLPIALIATTFSMTALGAGSLTIKAGEVFTVGPDQQRLMLDSLTIGDGAKVRFESGVSHWQIRAQQASIGNGVIVDASGMDGAIGEAGTGFRSGAGSCVSGKHGSDGGDGGNGGDAVSVRMQLGLVSLGNLKILSNGGDGGNGGPGGKGQDAGEFSTSCQSAPSGGDAGKGGDGGNGGDGGDVTVMYWPVSEPMKSIDVPALVQVSVEAGRSGAGGASGKAGAGSEGRYVKKRTLTGDRAWIGGGEAGAKADPGAPGEAGIEGRALIEQALVTSPVVMQPAPAPQPPAAPPAQKPNADQQEIRELKDTLKALMQRLDELEKK